jgi:hypothetical protein
VACPRPDAPPVTTSGVVLLICMGFSPRECSFAGFVDPVRFAGNA